VTQVFAQEVLLSIMLLHNSCLAGKVPRKEISSWNLSKKCITEFFIEGCILAEKLAGRSMGAKKVV
jgi:hypothetical protein